MPAPPTPWFMKDGKPTSVRKTTASVSSNDASVIECRSRKITEEDDRESLSSASTTSKTWSSSVAGMQKPMSGPFMMGPPIICPVVYVPVPYGGPYLPPHPQHFPPGPFLHPPHLQMLPPPPMARPLMPEMPLPGAPFHPFQLPPPHHHRHEDFSVDPTSSSSPQDDCESSASLSSSPPPAVTPKRILTISEPTTNQVVDMSDLKHHVSSDVHSINASKEVSPGPVPSQVDPKDFELKEFTASAQFTALKGEQIHWSCPAEGFAAPMFLSRIDLFPLLPVIGDWYLLTFGFYPRSVGISQCPVVRVSQAKFIEPPPVPYFWSRDVSDAIISPTKGEKLATVRLSYDATEAATSNKVKEATIVAAIGAESEHEYELFTVPWRLIRVKKSYFRENPRIGTWFSLIVQFLNDEQVVVRNWAVATPLDSSVAPVEFRVRNGRFEVRTRIGARYRAPEMMLYAQSEELGRVLDCDRRIWRTMKEKETIDCWCARREASDPSFEDAQWKVVEVIRDAVKAPTPTKSEPLMLSNGTSSKTEDKQSSTSAVQKLDTNKVAQMIRDAVKSTTPPTSVPIMLSNGTSSKTDDTSSSISASQTLEVDTNKVVTITAAINASANEDEYELFTVPCPSKRLKAKKIFFRTNASMGTWFKLVAQYVSSDTISVRRAAPAKPVIPTRICDGALQVRTRIFDQALLFTEGAGASCAVLCARSAELGRVMDSDGVLDHCFEVEIDCWCARRAPGDPTPKDVEWKIVALADADEESVKEEEVADPTDSHAGFEESTLCDVKRELTDFVDDTPDASTWNCEVDNWDEKPAMHQSRPSDAMDEKSPQASFQNSEPERAKLVSSATDAKTDKSSATAQTSPRQRYIAEGCQGVVCFKDAGLCFVYCAELGCEALLSDPPRYTDPGNWLEFNAIVGESSELLAVEPKEIKPKFMSSPLYRSVLVECQVTVPSPDGSRGEFYVTSNFVERVLDKHGIVAAWAATPGTYKAVIRFVYEEGAPCGFWQLEYLEEKL